MRPQATAPGEVDEGKWLRPILWCSFTLSVVFVTIEVHGRLSTGDPAASLTALILLAFIAGEVAALWSLRRNRPGLAAGIFAWALLGMSLASSPLTSFITPPLMLIPLFAMAVGLPFLQGAALRALMAGACLTELLVTLWSSQFLPEGGPLPPFVKAFHFVMATTSIALLIAFLLGQFSRRIRSSLDVARSAVSVREEFLSIASHELQTPLTVLKLHLQRVAQTAALDASAEAKLQLAELQVNKLSRLVANMLDLSRLQANRMQLDLRPVRLAPLVERVVNELRPVAERTGSSITLTVQKSVAGTWDTMRVEQVVSNLLSNAIKYGDGKPIHVSVDQDGTYGVVDVQDQGSGISPADMQRLFIQFERGSHNRAQSGVGLGLYIARQLSERMGGTVTLSSERERGTTFTLKLPADVRAP